MMPSLAASTSTAGSGRWSTHLTSGWGDDRARGWDDDMLAPESQSKSDGDLHRNVQCEFATPKFIQDSCQITKNREYGHEKSSKTKFREFVFAVSFLKNRIKTVS
jgi:hypothetical protein